MSVKRGENWQQTIEDQRRKKSSKTRKINDDNENEEKATTTIDNNDDNIIISIILNINIYDMSALVAINITTNRLYILIVAQQQILRRRNINNKPQ